MFVFERGVAAISMHAAEVHDKRESTPLSPDEQVMGTNERGKAIEAQQSSCNRRCRLNFVAECVLATLGRFCNA